MVDGVFLFIFLWNQSPQFELIIIYAISIWDIPMDFRSLADRSDVTEEEEEVYDKQRE